MTLKELQAIKNKGGWGWVFAPEGIIDGYKCTVTGCILPCIFEGFPKGLSVWYSICAVHGWLLGMNAYFDESTGGHTHEAHND